MFFALSISVFSGMLISFSYVTVFIWICFIGVQITFECHLRKVVDLSIYKVLLERHLTLRQCSTSANFMLVLSFVTQLQHNKKFYDPVSCASFYLVENKFYSTFMTLSYTFCRQL